MIPLPGLRNNHFQLLLQTLYINTLAVCPNRSLQQRNPNENRYASSLQLPDTRGGEVLRNLCVGEAFLSLLSYSGKNNSSQIHAGISNYAKS